MRRTPSHYLLDRLAGSGPARSSGAAAGYLLLEALATLAISAVILVGLASVVRLVLVAGDRTAAGAQSVEITTRTLDALARDLRLMGNAQWSGTASGVTPDFAFAGSRDTILFTREVQQPDGLQAPVVVTFQATRVGPETRLLRTEALLNPGARGVADLQFRAAEEVYRGPLRVEFSYRARKPTGAADFDVWSDPTDLPAAVRIDLIDDKDASRMASRTVLPFVNSEAGCLLPKTFSCRDKQNSPTSADGGTPSAGSASAPAR